MNTDAELSGLTAAEVSARVDAGQVNTLPARSGRTTWGIVRANVVTRVNGILFVLFVIVLATGSPAQGAFAMLIVANSIIGIVQELRAKRTLDNLAVVGEAHPVVLRDGERRQITRDDVVLDDLILIYPGDQIVVDGSVVAADYLEVDESMLTGEADPVAKEPGDGVLSGAFVVSGSGVYRAEKVGADAYAAQLTAQAAKFTLVHSELRQGINQILRYVSYLLVPVGALTIYVQFSQPDTTWQESALRMVGALVPMVPEGLVLLTSMAFALGVIRLGRRRCLVQELPAIEGLARVSVVCADKTGTLTQNTMTLAEIIEVGGGDGASAREVLAQLVTADPAPNASLQAVAAAVGVAAQPWLVTARAPFTSAKKWSGATFDGEGSWVLGAPDVLAEPAAAAQADLIAASGRRVLLLGRASTPVDDPSPPGPVVRHSNPVVPLRMKVVSILPPCARVMQRLAKPCQSTLPVPSAANDSSHVPSGCSQDRLAPAAAIGPAPTSPSIAISPSRDACVGDHSPTRQHAPSLSMPGGWPISYVAAPLASVVVASTRYTTSSRQAVTLSGGAIQTPGVSEKPTDRPASIPVCASEYSLPRANDSRSRCSTNGCDATRCVVGPVMRRSAPGCGADAIRRPAGWRILPSR